MNKFDYMMEIIAEKSVNFAQVLAIDQQFGLFHRAWCIAELAEARLLRMPQHATRMARLSALDIYIIIYNDIDSGRFNPCTRAPIAISRGQK